MCKTSDLVTLRIYCENAEPILLASFVAGLMGISGKQIRYAKQCDIQQALAIALLVQKAEKKNGLMSALKQDSIIQYDC